LIGDKVRGSIPAPDNASDDSIVRHIYPAGLAFSYRRVESFLETLGVRRSYEAVRQWVQRFAKSSRAALS